MGKFVATSKATGKRYLVRTDLDDIQKELLQVMRNSPDFDVRDYVPNAETGKIWAICLKEIVK